MTFTKGSLLVYYINTMAKAKAAKPTTMGKIQRNWWMDVELHDRILDVQAQFSYPSYKDTLTNLVTAGLRLAHTGRLEEVLNEK